MSRPILHTQFFKDHGPKRDFYRRFQNHYTWSRQVLPVYEWEGLLFVATDVSDLLESPPGDWPGNWVLIESNSADLENLWIEFQEGNESSFHTQTNLKNSPTTSGILILPDLPDLELELIDSDSNFKPSALHSAVNQIVPAKVSGVTITAPATAQVVAPVMDDLESLMNAVTAPEPLMLFENPEEGSDLLEGLSPTAAPVTLSKIATDEPIFEDTLPPTPRASILKKSNELPPVPAIAEIDELTPTPPPMTPASEPILAAPQKKSEIPLPNEERLLIDQLPKFYQRGFLALKAGNSIRLVSWPRDMTAELATKEKDFSLSPPSPFRIVLRTEKPYHGYLIQTPFMTQVLAAWNSTQYPETLTVVPVRSDNLVVGFLICMGNKEAERKTGLQAVEKVAESLGEKWKKIGPQFTKAA